MPSFLLTDRAVGATSHLDDACVDSDRQATDRDGKAAEPGDNDDWVFKRLSHDGD